MNRNDFEECINKTATTTDKWSTDKQQQYVDNVVRCEGMSGCNYVSCTTANPNTGYAATHQTQITWECQQRITCKLAGGMQQTQTAVQECITQVSNQLNADPNAQVAFDGRSARCGTTMGCAYNTCQ